MSSTFFHDFTIADAFGETAIKDTYKRAVQEWKHDAEMISELEVALNHKIWQHWKADAIDRSKLYDTLWKELHNNNLDRCEVDPEFSRIHFAITD